MGYRECPITLSISLLLFAALVIDISPPIKSQLWVSLSWFLSSESEVLDLAECNYSDPGVINV